MLGDRAYALLATTFDRGQAPGPDLSWRSFQEHWNEACRSNGKESWIYKDHRRLRRDYLAALNALAKPKYDPTVIYQSTGDYRLRPVIRLKPVEWESWVAR